MLWYTIFFHKCSWIVINFHYLSILFCSIQFYPTFTDWRQKKKVCVVSNSPGSSASIDKRKPLLLRYLLRDVSNKLNATSRTDKDIQIATRSTKALKTRWQDHPLQALVKASTKTQALKTQWQDHPLQALVKASTKTQVLKSRWQGHLLQALVDWKAKTQA